MWSCLRCDEVDQVNEEEIPDMNDNLEEEFPSDFTTVMKKCVKMPKLNNGVRVPQREKKNNSKEQTNCGKNVVRVPQREEENNNKEQTNCGKNVGNVRSLGYQPKSTINQHLNIFVPIPNNELNNYEKQRHGQGGDAGQFLRIEGVMDSGASESVAPPDLCPEYPIRPSPGSRCKQM